MLLRLFFRLFAPSIRARTELDIEPTQGRSNTLGAFNLKIHNQKDFWSGVMFVVIGILFMLWSQAYQFGTASRMGPGYFPTVLGGMQVVFGLMVMWPSLKGPEVKVERFGWRGLFVILGAVALYAILLPHVGFVVALVALILISAWASPEFGWKESLISVVVLGILSYLVFVVGLELQFTVWPDFIVAR